MSRDRDMGRIAFCRAESIGAPKLVFAAQWLAYAIACQRFASPLTGRRGRCGSLHLHRRGLTWAFSGQVVRFFGTSKKLRLLFRYPRSEPYFMTWWVPHQIKLTSGRHSKQLHQYPAFGGWGSGGRDHSFTRLFKPVHCSVPIAWIRQDRLGPGDWGIVLERLRSDGLHRGALDDDAAD